MSYILNSFKEILEKSINNDFGDFLEREIGNVVEVSSSVVIVVGFNKIKYNEAVVINGKIGYTALISESCCKIVMLDNTDDITIGNEVRRTYKSVKIPVCDALIGRVVDGLGRKLDNGVQIDICNTLPIEIPSKAVLERKQVNIPLQTGIKIIDCLIPIGRGQRELILGDRQTGKTSIAIDTIINQNNKNIICIYCAIGQSDSHIRTIINTLEEHDAMKYTIVVNSSATSPAGLQCITPYSATSIAEYFCEQGRDVFIVYDDLTKHARVYREISLLLKKSPGREAYPGDIFYLHSRLLERSGNFLNGGSITSFPIVETEEENVSAYIPTNIISITDGQIYLSQLNFNKGNLPAIDVSKSVSRVGSKAQTKTLKQVVGTLGVNYAQFQELESFSKFSTKLDETTQNIINKGQAIKEILKQDRFECISLTGMIAVLLCINNDIFNNIEQENIKNFEKQVIKIMDMEFSLIVKIIEKRERLQPEQIEKFLERIKKEISNRNNNRYP
jgi:F-type H+-transporting ATPase subunit alpha